MRLSFVLWCQEIIPYGAQPRIHSEIPVGQRLHRDDMIRLDKMGPEKQLCPLVSHSNQSQYIKYPQFILRFLSLTRVLQVRSFTTILEAGLVGQLVVDQAAASTRELSYLPTDRANPVDNTTIQCWAPSAGHPASS